MKFKSLIDGLNGLTSRLYSIEKEISELNRVSEKIIKMYVIKDKEIKENGFRDSIWRNNDKEFYRTEDRFMSLDCRSRRCITKSK